MHVTTERKLVDVKRLAELTGKHEETIRRWCRARTVPFVKMGREYMFDPVAVFEHFAKQSMVESLGDIISNESLPAAIRTQATELSVGILSGTISVRDLVG